MEIKAVKVHLELTYDELWSISCDIQRCLLEAVNRHWINHQLQWKEHEKDRLQKLHLFYSILGRIDLYEHTLSGIEEIFQKFNTKNKDSKK